MGIWKWTYTFWKFYQYAALVHRETEMIKEILDKELAKRREREKQRLKDPKSRELMKKSVD